MPASRARSRLGRTLHPSCQSLVRRHIHTFHKQLGTRAMIHDRGPRLLQEKQGVSPCTSPFMRGAAVARSTSTRTRSKAKTRSKAEDKNGNTRPTETDLFPRPQTAPTDPLADPHLRETSSHIRIKRFDMVRAREISNERRVERRGFVTTHLHARHIGSRGLRASIITSASGR